MFTFFQTDIFLFTWYVWRAETWLYCEQSDDEEQGMDKWVLKNKRAPVTVKTWICFPIFFLVSCTRGNYEVLKWRMECYASLLLFFACYLLFLYWFWDIIYWMLMVQSDVVLYRLWWSKSFNNFIVRILTVDHQPCNIVLRTLVCTY